MAESPRRRSRPPRQQQALNLHVAALLGCARCPRMLKPVVSGGPVLSRVMLVGQAPGIREPQVGRPFAWTAGRTMFGWFQRWCGWSEAEFRARIYLAAVCRCFPGRNATGGDRVPDRSEVENCAGWMEAEFALLEPELVIPVGRLAIAQFLPPFAKMETIIGRTFPITRWGQTFTVVPLPHPSGASPWHRMEPGITLLGQAMTQIAAHPAMRAAARL